MMRPVLLLATLLICLTGAGFAHFQLNLNVRIFHMLHDDGDIDLFVRTPMAYLVADKLGEAEGDGLPEPAPFTFNRMEDGTLMHLVDPSALRSDRLGLRYIAQDSLILNTPSGTAVAQVMAVRVHPLGSEPGFATLREAQASLATASVYPDPAPESYVGDTVVDVHLRYLDVGESRSYKLSSTLQPDLPGQDETANLLLDYRGDTIRTYRARGLLLEPIEVTGSAGSAAITFIVEGIRHILEGLDHVLFVICMVLGAATLRSLVARVTGFTLGPTVTLILGFFGLGPQGSWFIPLVETLIAVSIIYAAADAVMRPPKHAAGNGRAVAVTSLIGLLHGFGFSFMLQNILQVDAPNVWQSLLAFNIGVEIGQLMIVAFVWPLVLILRSQPDPVWRVASIATAAVTSLIAAFWVLERAGAIFV